MMEQTSQVTTYALYARQTIPDKEVGSRTKVDSMPVDPISPHMPLVMSWVDLILPRLLLMAGNE